MIASFSIVPLDQGESVSEHVALCLSLVQESGLPYQLTPMATVVEGEMDAVLGLISRCHRALRERSRRVLTRIEIDDREGREDALHSKVESVRSRLQDM
ncbi:MAG: MTH1187 family thiamine-binding protein [Candidatus Methanomethylophilaceae archaeon]|jgi:uncharacterized protein (TIGR00106 family)